MHKRFVERLCSQCKLPQPQKLDGTLHYDWCEKHDMQTCLACEELLESEEYEELAKIKK